MEAASRFELEIKVLQTSQAKSMTILLYLLYLKNLVFMHIIKDKLNLIKVSKYIKKIVSDCHGIVMKKHPF